MSESRLWHHLMRYGCHRTEHRGGLANWFLGISVQPATNHTLLMLHASSGATGNTWLSDREPYRQLAYEMWALFHVNPVLHFTSPCFTSLHFT